MSDRFRIEHHRLIGSTNDRAKELALKGMTRICVTAEGQEQGRGRRGRSFRSEPGCGLYLSAVIPIEEVQMLTIRAAVIVAEAVEELTGVSAGIKWVNDIYLYGKKVCGILAENVPGTESVVLGIGVNLKQQIFPKELAAIASDLETETGLVIEPEEMRDAILNRLCEPAPEDLLERYRRHCIVLGKPVTVFRGDETFDAVAVDLDETGGLIVERDGKRQTLASGEVSIRAKKD